MHYVFVMRITSNQNSVMIRSFIIVKKTKREVKELIFQNKNTELHSSKKANLIEVNDIVKLVQTSDSLIDMCFKDIQLYHQQENVPIQKLSFEAIVDQ